MSLSGKISAFVLVLLLVFASAPALAQLGSDPREDYVKRSLQTLLDSIKAEKWEAAADMMHRRTFDAMDECRRLAISSQNVNLDAYPRGAVVFVFLFRYLVPRQVLEEKTGRDFTVYLLKNNVINLRRLLEIDPQSVGVYVSGSFASVAADTPKGLFGLDFVHDSGSIWVWSMTTSRIWLENFFNLDFAYAGHSEAEFALACLRHEYGLTELEAKAILMGPLK